MISMSEPQDAASDCLSYSSSNDSSSDPINIVCITQWSGQVVLKSCKRALRQRPHTVTQTYYLGWEYHPYKISGISGALELGRRRVLDALEDGDEQNRKGWEM